MDKKGKGYSGIALALNENKSKYVIKFIEWCNTQTINAQLSTEEKLLRSWILWRNFTLNSQEKTIRLNALTVFRNSIPMERSREHISHLKKMCLHFGFCSEDIPEIALNNFCQSIQLKTYEPDEIIFLQGEEVRNQALYYMQLDGKVEFFAVSGQNETEGESMNKLSKQAYQDLSGSALRAKLGTKVFVRFNGPFGEMALLSGKPRTASVVVQQEANIVVCSKEVYNSCLFFHKKDVLNIELEAKVNLLASMSMLQTWTLSQISRLAYDIGKQQFDPEKTVIKQGDEVRKVGIVGEGEVVLLREFPPTRNSGVSSRSSQPSPKKIANILSGTMLGDIEAFYGKPTYKYSAKAVKGCVTVYWISIDKFQMHFIATNSETKRFIEESVSSRKRYYRAGLTKSSGQCQSSSFKQPAKAPCSFELRLKKMGHSVEMVKHEAARKRLASNPELNQPTPRDKALTSRIPLTRGCSENSITDLRQPFAHIGRSFSSDNMESVWSRTSAQESENLRQTETHSRSSTRPMIAHIGRSYSSSNMKMICGRTSSQGHRNSHGTEHRSRSSSPMNEAPLPKSFLQASNAREPTGPEKERRERFEKGMRAMEVAHSFKRSTTPTEMRAERLRHESQNQPLQLQLSWNHTRSRSPYQSFSTSPEPRRISGLSESMVSQSSWKTESFSVYKKAESFSKKTPEPVASLKRAGSAPDLSSNHSAFNESLSIQKRPTSSSQKMSEDFHSVKRADSVPSCDQKTSRAKLKEKPSIFIKTTSREPNKAVFGFKGPLHYPNFKVKVFCENNSKKK